MHAIIKQPGAPRKIGWHRDYPNRYLCGRESGHVRVMLCLDGMNERNGATRFMPGSHRISDAQAAEEKDAGIRHDLEAGAGVAAFCPPGGLVLIHPKVLHGSPPNESDRPRRNVVLQVGGDDVTGKETESITGVAIGRR